MGCRITFRMGYSTVALTQNTTVCGIFLYVFVDVAVFEFLYIVSITSPHSVE